MSGLQLPGGAAIVAIGMNLNKISIIFVHMKHEETD